ncbi:DEAD-box ATP-dependent RNA helicase 17 [Linum perenne]
MEIWNNQIAKPPSSLSKLRNRLFFCHQMLLLEAWISLKLDVLYSMILQEMLLNTFTGYTDLSVDICFYCHFFVQHVHKIMIINIVYPYCRVGRTARLGEKGDSILFMQPVEVDYLQELEKHGVSLTEYPVLKILDSFPLYGPTHGGKKSVFLDLHPWLISLQRALESFVGSEVIIPFLYHTMSWSIAPQFPSLFIPIYLHFKFLIISHDIS